MFKARISRWGSPAIFAGIVLAFLLPFATVSCSEETVTFTGAELAFRHVPEAENRSDHAETLSGDIEDESAHWAFVALVAAVVGLGLGVAGRRGGGLAAASGLLAMLFLLSDVMATLADVHLHPGFVLSLVGYLAVAAGHARAAWRRRRATRALRLARLGTARDACHDSSG